MLRQSLHLLMLAGLLVAASLARADEALVRQHCSGCHRESSPGHFQRISDIRKSPEGWVMTVFRMRQVHGVELSTEARDAIVRQLSRTNGLAPSESAAGRFALERRPNVKDLDLGADLQTMCARCHTAARVSLQRRDADEWLKLVHMHVGQWPSLEYQASSRDRFWWETATTELPGKLEALYPSKTAAWQDWRKRARVTLDGKWLVHGRSPGRGEYHGIATITPRGPEDYAASYAITYADGARVQGSSKAILYTGYEWRGTASLGEQSVREVFAASEDGSQLKGRWFLQEHNEIGGDWTATPAEGPAAILSVWPSALKTGSTQRVTLVGRGLSGSVDLGEGIESTVLERDASSVTVSVKVAARAKSGYRTIKVGRVTGANLLAVYDRIDRIEVEPGYAIARVGGGKTPPVSAQFEAVAYQNDVRLGVLPATWDIAPFDAQAEQDQDVRFAGNIDGSGRFMPAAAGPNPARKYSTNNAGNLFVVAKVMDGEREVEGRSHLIVTVQRWNTPPIY